jgi:hypothetical protein
METQIQQMQKTYARIKQALAVAKKAEQSLIEALPNSSIATFSHITEFELLTNQVRNSMVVTFIDIYRKELLGNNVTINPDEFINAMNEARGPLELDFDLLQEMLAPYLTRKDELAWREIVNDARRLIPIVWIDGEQTPVISAKGRTLNLNLFISREYYYIEFHQLKALSAIEKLVHHILTRVPPSKVEAKQLELIYRTCNFNKERMFATHKLSPPFDEIKLYKNSRLDLVFRSQETCEQVVNGLKWIYEKHTQQ